MLLRRGQRVDLSSIAQITSQPEDRLDSATARPIDTYTFVGSSQ
jgi:hypothetical protein